MRKELSCCKPGKGSTPRNDFDVPNENWSDGSITGIKIFQEILEAFEDGDSRNEVIMWSFLRDIGSAMEEKRGKSRRAAATKISWLMSDALLYFAKNSNFKKWLNSELEEAEKSKVYWDESEAKLNAEFVARMKAAKAAKAAKAVMEVTQ